MNCDSNKPDIKLPVKWPIDIFYLMGLRRSCSIEIQQMYIQKISRILKNWQSENEDYVMNILHNIKSISSYHIKT